MYIYRSAFGVHRSSCSVSDMASDFWATPNWGIWGWGEKVAPPTHTQMTNLTKIGVLGKNQVGTAGIFRHNLLPEAALPNAELPKNAPLKVE